MFSALQTRREALVSSFLEYRNWATLAKDQTGKSVATQIGEIYKLKNLGGQCGISDYYWHKLYDDNYLKGRGREDFIGWRLLQEFSLALHPRYAVLPAWDKINFSLIADASGLPIAPTAACFHPATHISGIFGHHLRTIDMAREFLSDPSVYPLFGKPSYSQGGYGALFLDGFCTEKNQLKLLDGKTLPLEEFLKRLTETVDHRYHKPQCGYLFQRPLQPSAEIFSLTSWSAICSVRIICLNDAGNVSPIRAALKIALPPNHTDNFGMGDHGNLLANVDLATGKINTPIGGFWPDTKIYQNHPTTGVQLEGFQIPGWREILDACEEAGSTFPLMKIHHWDFAITDAGPKMMELNDQGGTQIAQMHGHGLLTHEVRTFLKQHANSQQHPWVTAL